MTYTAETTHHTKRIRPGKYEYRGYVITRNSGNGRWYPRLAGEKRAKFAADKLVTALEGIDDIVDRNINLPYHFVMSIPAFRAKKALLRKFNKRVFQPCRKCVY